MAASVSKKYPKPGIELDWHVMRFRKPDAEYFLKRKISFFRYGGGSNNQLPSLQEWLLLGNPIFVKQRVVLKEWHFIGKVGFPDWGNDHVFVAMG